MIADKYAQMNVDLVFQVDKGHLKKGKNNFNDDGAANLSDNDRDGYDSDNSELLRRLNERSQGDEDEEEEEFKEPLEPL